MTSSSPADAPARVAWGVVADDLDDDGDDDLIFTFGVESLLLPSPRDAVASLALLQSESGTFSPSERFAFPDPNDAIDPVWQLPRANRGATLVDLDLDGDAELFVLSVNGPPRVFEHRSRRARCTARVQPRYVDHGGAGFAWRGEGEDTWRLLEVGGETQLSAPAFVLLPAQRGTLRFPSGGQATVDCGEAHAIDVAEPEWLRVSRVPGGVRVDVDASAVGSDSADVRVRALGGAAVEAVLVAGEGFLASYEAQTPDEVMVSIAGQWVARWLPVADPP